MRRVLRKIAKDDPDIGNSIILEQELFYQATSNGVVIGICRVTPSLTSTCIVNDCTSVTYRRYFHNGRWICCSSLARWI
jgi:hypothetical protein